MIKISDWISMVAIIVSPIFVLMVMLETQKREKKYSLDEHQESLCQILTKEISEIMKPIKELKNISNDIYANKIWTGSFYSPETIIKFTERLSTIDASNASIYFHLLSKTQAIITGTKRLEQLWDFYVEKIKSKEFSSIEKMRINDQSYVTAKDFIDYSVSAKRVIKLFGEDGACEYNAQKTNDQINEAKAFLNIWSNKAKVIN